MPEINIPAVFKSVQSKPTAPADIGPLFADLERAEANHVPLNDRLLRAAQIGAAYIRHALSGGDLRECVVPGDRAIAKIDALIAEAEQAARLPL